MKHKFFTTLIVLTMFSLKLSFAQGLTNAIDSKNGLLEFKFGSVPANFKGKIKPVNKTEVVKGNKTYEVLPSVYNNILGIPIQRIYLNFGLNKLWSIDIKFREDEDDSDFDFLKYKLINIFGQNHNPLNSDESTYLLYLGGLDWTGKKNSLQLINSQVKKTNKYYMSIYYRDRKLEQLINNTEF